MVLGSCPSPIVLSVKATTKLHLIHNLPTELLMIIFYFTAGPNLFGLTLSQVCRRWRQIALSSPLLWTQLDISRKNFHSTPLLPTFLKRASGAPLTIYYNTYRRCPFMEHALEVLRPYASTFETIEWDMSHFPISVRRDWILLAAMLAQMKRLREFDLRWYRSSMNVADATEILSNTLADLQLTRKELPRLSFLRCRGCCFPWGSNLYSALRVLELTDIVVPVMPPSVLDLLNILRSCPDLESFTWIRSLNRPMVNSEEAFLTPSKLEPVKLPKLLGLSITDSISRTLTFCDHIIAPSLDELAVEQAGHQLDNITAEEEVILKQLIFRPYFALCTHICLSWCPDYDFLQLNAAFWPLDEDAWQGEMEVRQSLVMTAETLETILNLFNPSKDTYKPSVTSFQARYDLPEEMWRICFRHLTGLTKFFPPVYDSRAFFDSFAILEEAEEDGSNGVIAPSLPHLQTLEWDRTVIDREMTDRLLRLVKRRSALGAPLQELIFTNSYDDGSADIQELSRLVKITIWCVDFIILLRAQA